MLCLRYCFFCCALYLIPALLDAESLRWERLGEDLEIARASQRSLLFFESEVIFLRTSLKAYDLQVIRSEDFGKPVTDVGTLCKRSGAALCLNANFFDEKGKALGLEFNKLHRGGKTLTGVFYLTRSGMGISSRKDLTSLAMLEAVQAGPRLIVDGEIVGGIRGGQNRSRRSGVCIDRKNRLLLFMVSKGLLGLSTEALQEMLIHPSLDCRDALNLDGGGSSQLFISQDVIHAEPDFRGIFIPGSDQVPVALALVPKS